MGNIQTALMEHESRSRVSYALDRLLHGLKRFVQAVPTRPDDDPMPEHDIVWVTEIENDPRQEIINTLKAYPELWLHALPEEVCIVPRKELEKISGLGSGSDVLGAMGENIVANYAARHRREMENI